MVRYRSSLHRYRNCKKGWMIWMIQENFKILNRFAVENYLTFPVSCSRSPSPRSMLSRDQSLRSDTWNLSETQWSVFGNPRAVTGSSQIPHQGILHSTNQSATGGIPVQRSTGRPVAKGEEQTGSTIPMPIFARRPSTMNSFFLSLQRKYHRILWLISKDCKSRSFILTNSSHLQRFHVGR